jgi:hypothetical protein
MPRSFYNGTCMAHESSRSCGLVGLRRVQRIKGGQRVVCFDGRRAGISAQKPASGWPSEGSGVMVRIPGDEKLDSCLRGRR